MKCVNSLSKNTLENIATYTIAAFENTTKTFSALVLYNQRLLIYPVASHDRSYFLHENNLDFLKKHILKIDPTLISFPKKSTPIHF